MRTILVVDDHPEGRLYLTTLLGYYGYRLQEAGDARDALALMRHSPPDLVITDIVMPTMDGYEFVRQLRSTSDTATIPVIFYSASYLERETRALAHACGVYNVLTKPARPEDIVRLVQEVLGEPDHAPTVADAAVYREDLGALASRLSETVHGLTASNQRLSALIELGQQLGRARDARAILEAATGSTRRLFGAACALTVLHGPIGEGVHFCVKGLAPPADLSPDVADRLLRSLDAIAGGRDVLRLRAGDDTPVPPDLSALGVPMTSVLCLALDSPGRRQGWMCVINKLGLQAFTEEDEQVGRTMATQMAIACENARLDADLERHVAALEREIEERGQTQRALRESEERYRRLFEDALTGVYVCAPDGGFLACNRAFTRLLALPSTDTGAGRDIHDFYRDGAEWDALVATLRSGGVPGFQEAEFVRADGTGAHVEQNLVGSFDASGRLVEVRGYAHDNTAHRRLEEQFRHAQKMEAVGRLAGGVAHDFNNILTVILGCTEALSDEQELAPFQADMRAHILGAAERACGLTRQLLAFSRKEVVRPQLLDLNVLVDQLTSMLQRLIGEDVTVVTRLDRERAIVRADAGQLEQMLLNLAVNARDAMPKGGTLTIEIRRPAADQPPVWDRGALRTGPQVQLVVADTGEGMTPEVRQRIFEPFFTTKGVGTGTGLGLSTVYGIVEQSGGHIAVASEPGMGTTFTIHLPLVVDGRPDLPMTPPTAVPAGHETLLLVEDEEPVRLLAKAMLEPLGYCLLVAASGPQALEMAAEHAGSIDLLLSDVVMPGMNGREVYERLDAARPGLRVIYMSGYTEDVIVRGGILRGQTGFLQKPFTRSSLARAVRLALDQDLANAG